MWPGLTPLGWVVVTGAAGLYLLLRRNAAVGVSTVAGWMLVLAAGFGLAALLLQPVHNFWLLLGFAVVAGWMGVRAVGSAVASTPRESWERALPCLAIAACLIGWNGGNATALSLVVLITPLIWLLFVRRPSAASRRAQPSPEAADRVQEAAAGPPSPSPRATEPLLVCIAWTLLAPVVLLTGAVVSEELGRIAAAAVHAPQPGIGETVRHRWDAQSLITVAAAAWLGWSAAALRVTSSPPGSE